MKAKRSSKKGRIKNTSAVNKEEYSIKFWYPKPDGYWEQREETFCIVLDKFSTPKCNHDKAEILCLEKYPEIKVYGKPDQDGIISITYC